jgi:thymidine phosphorylase
MTQMDTESIGRAVNHLTVVEEGGARTLDASGGVRFEKKLGEEVREGESVAVCFGGDQGRVEASVRQIASAVDIGDAPVAPSPTIL